MSEGIPAIGDSSWLKPSGASQSSQPVYKLKINGRDIQPNAKGWDKAVKEHILPLIQRYVQEGNSNLLSIKAYDLSTKDIETLAQGQHIAVSKDLLGETVKTMHALEQIFGKGPEKSGSCEVELVVEVPQGQQKKATLEEDPEAWMNETLEVFNSFIVEDPSLQISGKAAPKKQYGVPIQELEKTMSETLEHLSRVTKQNQKLQDQVQVLQGKLKEQKQPIESKSNETEQVSRETYLEKSKQAQQLERQVVKLKRENLELTNRLSGYEGQGREEASLHAKEKQVKDLHSQLHAQEELRKHAEMERDAALNQLDDYTGFFGKTPAELGQVVQAYRQMTEEKDYYKQIVDALLKDPQAAEIIERYISTNE